MIPHLKRSRILKALADRRDDSVEYDLAEKRLSEIRVAVALGRSQAATAAGQAAALTALATACKCFGHAALVADPETKLVKPLRIGDTVGTAATALGAALVADAPADATHLIAIGADAVGGARLFVRCWWDNWIAGVLPAWEERAPGGSGNPLSGIFAGALAVREIFATVLGHRRAGKRASIASVWDPWLAPDSAASGPVEVYLPSRLWFIGLGHLGQGFLWSLGFLPAAGVQAVLQDDQMAGEENEATGLLTSADDIGGRKTRIAAAWVEKAGWPTCLIERRHHGDIPLLDGDPAIVVTGLDDARPRLAIANTGFDYMVDGGVGHGPVDFETSQIRVLSKGDDPTAFWAEPEQAKDVDALLQKRAYRAYTDKFDRCGAVALAQGSVAVPFVGAAVGALAITQAIRIASMLETPRLIQMELGSPSMVTPGGMNAAPVTSLGSIKLRVG